MPLSSPTLPENFSYPARDVFLPLVVKNGGGTDVPMEPSFSPNAQEEILFALLLSSFYQERKGIVWNAIVASVARARCLDMAMRNYFGHVDPDGMGPNCHVCLAGFSMPEVYTLFLDANYIESIAAGQTSSTLAFEALMNSPSHRKHIMGEIDFYRGQRYLGVGFVTVEKSTFKHYCSIIFTEAA